MMTDKIGLELVAPERLLLAKQVEMAVLPGTEGRLGILPGHAPMVVSLRSGTVDVYENGKIVERLFVGGGFAEISAQRCVVLAETAIPVDEIDRAEVSRRIDELRLATEEQILTPEADPASPVGELVMRLAMLEAADDKVAAHR